MSVFDSLGSLGTGLGIAGGIAGGVASLVGTVEAYGAMQKANQAEQQVANVQTQIAGVSSNIFSADIQLNAQRQQQMNLNAQRNQMNYLRQQMTAMHTGVAAATSAGAQFGSALPGGEAGVSGTTGRNILASGENLQIGSNIFGLENTQSGFKMDIAQLQGQEAQYQGQADIWKGTASLDQSIGNSVGNFLKIL